MKKFRFNLKAVLREREIREDFEKRKVAEALLLLKKEENLLKDYYRKLKKNTMNFCDEKLRLEPDVKKLGALEVYAIFLRNQIIKQKLNIQEAEKKLRICQGELTNAMKRRKIISKLKERKKADYYLEIDRVEQKELDEYNVLKVAHEQHN